MKLCSSLVLQLLNNLTNSKRCSKKPLMQHSTVVKKTQHLSSKFCFIINNIITVHNEVVKVMFSQVCVCPQGGLPQCMLGRKHPPWEGCLSACWEGSTPWKDASVHAGKEPPPPREGCLSACWEGSTPQEGCLSAYWEGSTPRERQLLPAEGTQPTGMHSCLL